MTNENFKKESENDIVLKKISDLFESDRYDDSIKTIKSFEKKLKERGINAREYIFFHYLIGSTPPKEVTEYDTPNHDIEKLIMSL